MKNTLQTRFYNRACMNVKPCEIIPKCSYSVYYAAKVTFYLFFTVSAMKMQVMSKPVCI